MLILQKLESSRKVKKKEKTHQLVIWELLGFGSIFLLDFSLVMWNKDMFYKDVNVCPFLIFFFSLIYCQYFPKSFF